MTFVRGRIKLNLIGATLVVDFAKDKPLGEAELISSDKPVVKVEKPVMLKKRLHK